MENNLENVGQTTQAVPKTNGAKKSLLVALIIIVVALALAGGWYYWTSKAKMAKSTQVALQLAVNTPARTNITLASLVGESKVVFPDVAKLLPVDPKKMSKENNDLILPNAAQISMKNLSYVDSQTGFFITYQIASSSVKDFMSSISRFGQGKWQVTGGYSSNFAAVLDLQNTVSGALGQVKYILSGTVGQVAVKTLDKVK